MQKKFQKIAAVSLLTVMSVSTLCGCTKKETPPASTETGKQVALTLWGSKDDQKMLAEMVEGFKKENPSNTYEITLGEKGEDESASAVATDIGAAADVFATAHNKLAALVEQKAVYPNKKYADEIKKSSTEGAVLASTYNGTLYAYPATQKTYVLFYDKRIYKDSDVKSLDTLLSANVPQGVVKLGYDIGNSFFSSGLFLTNGCEIFGPDGTDKTKLTWNNEAGLEMANYLTTLGKKGVVQMDDQGADTQFEAGKLGAYVCGDWKTASFKEKLKGNYGVVELPDVTLKSGTKHMKSLASYNVYCVNAQTKFPTEAMALANYITNKKSQLARFTQRELLPVNKEAMAEEKVQSDVTVKAILAQMKYSQPIPMILQMDKFWDPTGAIIKDLFDGKIASAQIQAKLDQYVKDVTG